MLFGGVRLPWMAAPLGVLVMRNRLASFIGSPVGATPWNRVLATSGERGIRGGEKRKVHR